MADAPRYVEQPPLAGITDGLIKALLTKACSEHMMQRCTFQLLVNYALISACI